MGIKEVRIAMGITQVEFAKKLKIKQPYLSSLETKRVEPTLEMLKKVKKLAQSKGIEVTYEQLLGE